MQRPALKKYRYNMLVGITTVAVVFFTQLTGCIKLALRCSPSLFDDFSRTFFEECDPQLAKEALPGQLKLGEALLCEDPTNAKILTSLCIGYTGYSLLFIEKAEPARASNLYRRGPNYGLKALGIPQELVKKGNIERLVENLEDSDLSTIFWTSVAWLRWINLNLDRPSAIAQLPVAIALLRHVMEKRPNFFMVCPMRLWALFLHPISQSLAPA